MLVRGHRCPVLSVSAEYTVIDVTAVADAAVGDVVTVIGEDGGETIAVEDVARPAGRPQCRLLDGRPAQRPVPLRGRLTRLRMVSTLDQCFRGSSREGRRHRRLDPCPSSSTELL